MPELHRVFRERISEIDHGDESSGSLDIDIIVLAIWMFGDRELVVDHFEQFTGENVVIRDGIYDPFMCIALHSVEEHTWLECAASLADHIPQILHGVGGLGFKLVICYERTLQLANVVLDRVKVIRDLHVCVDGFDPSPSSTQKFIQVLDRSSPLDYLVLEGITDRLDFWSKTLKYAFLKPPKGLALGPGRDSRLVPTLAAMRYTTTLVPRVCLRNCIIDDELLSLLLTMPLSSVCFLDSSRIRGNFSTEAGSLASNTTLKELVVECYEVYSSFTDVLSNGIANNTTLELLRVTSAKPFPALCRGVARNGSIRRAVLPVSSPMDVACMYELAQSPSLQVLSLIVRSGVGGFSWMAMATFLRANRSIKDLGILNRSEGNDPSVDDLRLLGQSLADNASLETLELRSPSHILTWNGCAGFVTGLGCNTTLRSLTFEASEMLPSRTAFEQAMERNYGLELVVILNSESTELVRFIEDDSTPMVETICKLNAAGRKYMLADPTSREKGVDVLSRVIHNLDCVYYHLRENPSLCNLNEHLNEVSASPAKSSKRRSRPHSNADQFFGGPSGSSLLRHRVAVKRPRTSSNDFASH